MPDTTRRGFLKLLGLGAAAVAAEPIIEPVRKLWFVGSNAPVGSRIELHDGFEYPETIARARKLKRALYADLDGHSWTRMFKERYGSFVEPLPRDATLAEFSAFVGAKTVGPQTPAGRLEAWNDFGKVGALSPKTFREFLNANIDKLSPGMAIQTSSTSDHIDVLDRSRVIGRISYEDAEAGRWRMGPVRSPVMQELRREVMKELGYDT